MTSIKTRNWKIESATSINRVTDEIQISINQESIEELFDFGDQTIEWLSKIA